MARSSELALPLPALGRRLLAAALLLPVVIWGSLTGGWVFFVLTALCSLRASWEYGAMRRARGRRAVFPAIAAMVLAILAACHWGGEAGGAALLALLALGLLGADALRGRCESGTERAGEKILLLVYLAWLPGHWILLRDLPASTGLPDAAGGRWFLFAAGVTWLGDTFAYFVGSLWGRHSLRSPVSPRKSVEGVIGGAAGAALSAWLLAPAWVPFLAGWPALLVGLLLSLAGQLGDLFESLLKRDAAIKDSGKLLPGHGGLLDRVDSMLFAIPVFYYLLRWAIF